VTGIQSFFTKKAAGMARKNKIKHIRCEDGQFTKDKKEMSKMTKAFFEQLYMADPNVCPLELLQMVEPKVTESMNEDLCKEYSDEEIGDALFQIGPIKAPGPDGFSARFFQRNWDVLKQDVTRGVRQFFESGRMVEDVNNTTIVLIQKKDNPEMLKDFRPISLCNIIYKVVSKCLANRLRPLLQDMIAPTQSAFVPGRMITDNALIAFECLHAIRSGSKACKKYGVYKLDLTKAYDCVEWCFLEEILERLDFQSKWRQWVMECVTSVKYVVRFNNEMLDPIKPSCGLRQGDPLLPYLFLCVADGLSCILQKEVEGGALHELSICRNTPGISHLLFTDNTLLFLEANEYQAKMVDRAL
jgi:hypothetical protein